MANYKKSLTLVLEQLDENETIKESIYGSIEQPESVTNGKGLFVATEKRVIFFQKKMFGTNIESFPYNTISSIQKKKSWLGGKSIVILSSLSAIAIDSIFDGDDDKFVKFISSQIGNSGQTTIIKEIDIPAQIKKLADLKEQGILSEQEFNIKKVELLDKM